MARKLVKSGVDTVKMAQAGMVQNYEGEAIAAVGTIIGQAFEEGLKRKDQVDKDLEEEQQVLQEKAKEVFENQDISGKAADLLDPFKTESKLPELGVLKERPQAPKKAGEVYSLDMFQSDFMAKQIKAGMSPDEAKKSAISERGKAENWLMSTYGTLNPTAEQKKMKSGQTVNNEVIASYDEASKEYMSNTAVPTKGSTTMGSAGVKADPAPKRLKDGTPFARLAKVFGGNDNRGRRQRTPLSNEDFFNRQSAQQTRSQLSNDKDRTFVPQQQYLRTPSWASGSSVGAAIEGWNIGAEADNYRNQLEADIKDSQEREWKGLVEEAKARSTEDTSLLALFDSYKAQYADAQSLPPNEREEAFSKILGGVASVEKAKNQHNQIMETIKGDRNNIAWNMMPEEQQDELLQFLNGGGTMGFLPGEDGKIYYTGKTKNGMPYRKSLDTLLDSENGILNYPKKVDVYGIIDTIANDVEKDKYMTEIEGPDGMIRKVPIPIEQLQQELDFEIDQAISQYGAKSLAANMPAFQGKGGYAKFKAGMNVDSSLAGNSINVLKRNMVEALHHKLGGYMAQEKVTAGAGYKSRLRMMEEQNKQVNRISLAEQKGEIANQKEIVKTQNKGKGTPADYAASAKYLLSNPSEGSNEVITQQGDQDPETTGEQPFVYYPNLDNMQGEGIGAVDQSNGQLTIYAPQTQKEKDGKTTTSSEILKVIDLSQPIDKLQQDLANVTKEFNIIYNKPGLPGKKNKTD